METGVVVAGALMDAMAAVVVALVMLPDATVVVALVMLPDATVVGTGVVVGAEVAAVVVVVTTWHTLAATRTSAKVRNGIAHAHMHIL